MTRRPSEKQTIAASPKPARGPVALLIGTRKGAFFLRSDGARRTWKLTEPMFDHVFTCARKIIEQASRLTKD